MTLTEAPSAGPPQRFRNFDYVGAELEAKAGRLKTVVARLRDESDGEFAARGAERRQLERLIELCEIELADIADALDRARRGTYGMCEPCGRVIPRERLEAMPESRTCVECANEPPRLGTSPRLDLASTQPTERNNTMLRHHAPRPAATDSPLRGGVR